MGDGGDSKESDGGNLTWRVSDFLAAGRTASKLDTVSQDIVGM